MFLSYKANKWVSYIYIRMDIHIHELSDICVYINFFVVGPKRE